MNNIGIVERYVRFAERGAVSGIKSGVPLLIFIAEPDHYEIGVLDQSAGADRINLRGLVVAPKIAVRLGQVVTCCVGGGVIGDGRGGGSAQASFGCAALNFVAPLCVDLLRKIDSETDSWLLHSCDTADR